MECICSTLAVSAVLVAAVCLVLCAGPSAAAGEAEAGPELLSVTRIWDQGRHNAFTDLCRFRDEWFCSFREADDHVGGDGVIRILRSDDGETWESAAALTEEGIDLRDPKLSITPDNRLMVVAGGSVYQGGKTLLGRRPRVAFSEDGTTWTPTQPVLGDGDWLWRVTWHEGTAYGVSYNIDAPDDWSLTLYKSGDGLDWTPVTVLAVPEQPNETTVRFLADGRMVAFVRREKGEGMAWIGTSPPPYTEWSWHETGYRVGGPNFIVLPDGTMWAGGRYYPGGARTVIARFGPETYEPALTLPSGGDNSYPGLVWHENLLWVSYYSSHEEKSSIYLAKIRLPEAP